MLTLSRKQFERIKIGNDITVEVRRIGGKRVTLAIGAPRDVPIVRGELERVPADEWGNPLSDDSAERAQDCQRPQGVGHRDRAGFA